MKIRDFTVLFLVLAIIYFVIQFASYVNWAYGKDSYSKGKCVEGYSKDTLRCATKEDFCVIRFINRNDKITFQCRKPE